MSYDLYLFKTDVDPAGAYDPDRDSQDAEKVHRRAQGLIAEELAKLDDAERLPWWRRLFR